MKTKLAEILNTLRSIEPLPHVALRVLELSQRSDVVPRELIEVIQAEPALTAKVLRLTNSAYYGFKRQIASLDEAGNLLGTSTLVNLVLTGCASRYFHDSPALDESVRQQRWRRSVSNALAANLLARIAHGGDRNRAYTAGLLQDLGEVVLDRFVAAERPALEAAHAAGLSRADAETEVFGLSHAEAGARLAQRWNFPDVLIDTIRFHHAPQHATVDPLLANIVHLAHEVVEELDRNAHAAAAHPAPALPLAASGATGHRALRALGLDSAALTALQGTLAQELEKARDLIEA